MKSIIRACLAFVVCVACASPPAKGPSKAASSETPRSEIFRFHVGLWANLHQVLLHESLLPKPGFEGPKSLAHRSMAPMEDVAPADAKPWRDALAYYDHRFTTRNTFSDENVEAVRFLTAHDSEATLPSSAGVAAEWTSLLVGVAPLYRARFWSAHERGDRAYIATIEPLVAKHGDWFVKRLAALYETPWPTTPVDVEVAPAVPPFGASTVGDPPYTGKDTPLIIVSSIDPGYSGESGLEMIFHEGSHLLVGRVEQMIEASAKRQARTLPWKLWHFVLFYTAGHVAKERLGPSYVPYAERPEQRVFDADTANILTVLVREWQPYLDGRTTLSAAVDAVVASF